MDVEYEVDVDEINRRWEDLASVDLWSQMIIKETGSAVEQLTQVARTGQWYFADAGELHFRRAALDWHQLQNENECFFLRIYGPGDYRWKGADLGVLVTKGRLQTEDPDDSGAGAGSGASTPDDHGGDPVAGASGPHGPDLISGRESDAAPVNEHGDDGTGAAALGTSRLTSRALRLIDAIRAQFAGTPVGEEFVPPANPVGVKSGG